MKIISEQNPEALDLATKSLKAGKLISFATDTVYGIACDASNKEAVEQLYNLKKRQSEKPIVIFLPNIAVAKSIFVFNKLTEKVVEKLFDHSPTLVLELKKDINLKLADNLNNNRDNFLGFRVVNHKFIADLLASFGGILAVSSANISGQNPAITAKDVERYFFNSSLDLLVDGGTCQKKIASTVIKIEGEKIEILRPGNIEKSQINF